MNVIVPVLIFSVILGQVAGQLVLKKAMTSSEKVGFRSPKFLVPFFVGLCLMTVQFFLGLGLLQRYDLSFVYPFQGLGVIMITFAATFLLREKLTLQLTVGSILISVGVILVSLS